MSASRGRAAELQVAGQLLRQDWGVYFPFVDKGIDLVTEINSRFVSIQVKESKLYRQGVYWQQVFKKPFDNIKGENTFLIFVLRREKETNYLIIPSLWFDKHAEEFYYDAKNRRWFLYFKLEDGKALETRQSQLDLTPFLNNWEQLKHVANKRDRSNRKSNTLNKPSFQEKRNVWVLRGTPELSAQPLPYETLTFSNSYIHI